MPKRAGEKDSLVMKAVGLTVERHAHNGLLAATEAAADPQVLRQTLDGLDGVHVMQNHDVRKRWLLLKSVARLQTLDTCYGMHRVLDASGKPADKVRASRPIARAVGRLGDAEARTFTGDMAEYPYDWFEWDDNTDALRLTTKAERRLEPHYRRGVGCSALAYTVEVNGRPHQLYDVFWDYFSDEYLRTYGSDIGTYSSPSIYRPNF